MRSRLTIFLCLLFALTEIVSLHSASSPAVKQQAVPVPKDTVSKKQVMALRYPVRRTIPETSEENAALLPADLKNPQNVGTFIEYDPLTGIYEMKTKLGEEEISTPINLTEEEYLDYQQKQSSAAYWREKNKVDFSKKKEDFSLTDLQFDLGAGDKIFGEGGVKLMTQGSIETKFGLKNNKVDNPSLSENARNRTYFNFDQNIQMSVNGKVGDKINVNMNYDTEAAFDYDAKAIKLHYEGKEDEIIKSIEGGNVSMPVNSSLISGGSSLFGVKTALQFGKLSMTAVISQQQSQTRSVSLKNGVQTTDFNLDVAAYDENRHYFLSQYFKNNYDSWMSKLPYISSGMSVTKVEVWVTNKTGVLDNARNIVAFADMGEPATIFKSHWKNTTGATIPANSSNTLYREIIDQYAAARNFSDANATLAPLSVDGVRVGEDYERLESARRLDPSEYTLNSTLGYISLRQALNSDEILAVAYEYVKNGQTYQVGEFSTDGIESPKTLFVKLLKGTDYSPSSPTWELMMKNIYSIGAYNMESEDFKLDITYKSDSLGTDINYLSEGNIRNTLLLRVMNLDRLNSKMEAYPDGTFDYVEGYTVQASYGRIIFPVLKPFGAHLRKAIGNEAIAAKYVFEELYDSTLTVAQQLTEKNKFRISGSYKASSGGATISLGATNVANGSVVVTAGGQTLTENTDYTVDYASGTVTILNEALIASGTAINATCEDQSTFSMMRKSMAGLSLDYKFSDNFNLGGTVMHLSEKPLTTKVDMGYESVANTIWGVNTSFKTESQFLTNLLDKLPFIEATKPSQFSMNGEFAQLIAGSSKTLKNQSYVDDFESSEKAISLKDLSQWYLASTPYDPAGKFPEASLSDDIHYGFNRSLLAWYAIDGIFTQNNSSQTPSHIRNDQDQLSNHYVRAVREREIFPDRDLAYNQTGILSVMNLAYYPKERGPYNFDWRTMNPDGTLKDPQNRWGGIMRRIESGYTNFESNNVEYIEFWMMDPFVYDSLGVSTGGDLYFNLGEISEDVLKDGKRSFENGLPTSASDTSLISTTHWGKVSAKTSTAYAFDNTAGVRALQDVGLDGLGTEEEKKWDAGYIEGVRSKVVDPVAIERMEKDPFSPVNDPAGDNYHYYRGTDFDNQKTSILDRYKHYNGYEGNSQSPEQSGESYSTAATTLPNVEDINLDFTLNETERYYLYHISLRHKDMEVGKNFIKDKRTSSVTLKNGKVEQVSWYQFKIPISEYEKKVGTISGFNSIRFIRMYLTGFEDSTILRLASLDLVRGDWRNYTKDLYPPETVPVTEASVDVSTVSLEENSGRTPINYKLPPGVDRETDPSQPGVYLQDEQSLSVKVTGLSPGDARAVYKNTSYDFRQYDRLQMFVHSEAFEKDMNPPKDYEMTVFMRLGSDYQNNYYEYEIPLEISEPYVNVASAIWPANNFFDIPFDLLTKIKNHRNSAGYPVSYTKEYFEFDPDHDQNKVKIMGNPSLADVKTIMIGVRNNGTTVKSVEIWVNELRLSGFKEEGGYAALGSAVLGLSDLGTVTASGRYESDGFGGLEQSVSERRMDSYGQYNMAFNFNLGRFLPQKAKVNIPLFYSYSKETLTPKYDPLNEDLLLSDVLDATKNKAQRDSILNYSQTLKTYKSLSLTNAKIDLKSKTPLPIDPANFTFNYSQNQAFERNATTEYEMTKNYTGGINYAYSSPLKAWQPFAKNKKMVSPWYKSLKEFNLNFLPNSITANTNLTRYYYELQSRDLTSKNPGEISPLTVSKNFLWNTDLSVNWSITKNLKLFYTLNNRAEVEETLTAPVNKELFATEYQNWKDTVSRSLREFGTPLDYSQTVNLTWQVPLDRIPALDFMNMNTQYNSVYEWIRSSTADTETDLGNQVSNQKVLSLNASANLINLYNKSDFLKNVNRKLTETRRPLPVPKKTAPGDKQMKTPEEKPVVKELKKYEKETTIVKDSVLLIRHNLKNKRIFLVAIDSAGRRVPLKYKVKDENSVQVYGQENRTLKLSVIQKPSLEEEGWYQVAEMAARTLMAVRNISVTYKQTDGMTIPGFKPESGLIGRTAYGSAPGWDFALGLQPEDYLKRAMDKDWLIVADSITSPAIMTKVTDLRIKSTLEPLKGLKIDLNAVRSWSYNTQIQYMFDGMPENKTGSFTMTTIALSTAFKSSKAADGYTSDAFRHFLDNRKVIAARLEKRMLGKTYPDAGFLSGTPLVNKPYDAANGTFALNSADVLIPAFLAAYTGKDAQRSNLDIFPGLKALLPNWTISYDGLSNLDFIRKHFRNVTINHAYTCTYSASSFSSYSTFVNAGDGLGFVRDVLTNNPLPSSMYDVSSVTLTEAFNPLFRLQGTLLNGWTFNTELRKNRTMNLSISGGQIVEADQDQYAVGTNYKISNFHPWGILEKSKIKNDLSLSGKLSYKNQHSLLRKIEESYTQASSGNKTFVLELTGDYVISKNMNMTLFYDYESTVPLVSSYPVSSSDFGFSVRFTLNR